MNSDHCVYEELLDQLRSAEAIARREVLLLEEIAFATLDVRALKSRREVQRKLITQHAREDERLMQARRTLHRRINSLVHDEARRREEIEQQEDLQLAAIVRNLGRNIQADVDVMQYLESQRVKYFIKTHVIILRNEAGERRDITKSERYEWLVLTQRYDAAATQLAARIKLMDFRGGRSPKVAASEVQRQPPSSPGADRGSRRIESGGGSPSRGVSRGVMYSPRTVSSGVPALPVLGVVRPRIDDRLPSEYYRRAMESLGSREGESRATLEASERSERGAIERARQHVKTNYFLCVQRDALSSLDDAARGYVRLLRDLEHRESFARAAVCTEERAGWMAVERRWVRLLVSRDKILKRDVTRRITDRRKLEDRQQRMAYARLHFAERQALLSDNALRVVRSSSSSQSLPSPMAPHRPPLPFAGMPPPSSQTNRAPTMLSDPEAQRTRLSIASRALHVVQAAGRLGIEKAERLERHALLATAFPGKDRHSEAAERRSKQDATWERERIARLSRESTRSGMRVAALDTASATRLAMHRIDRDERMARATIRTNEHVEAAVLWRRLGELDRARHASEILFHAEETARGAIETSEERLWGLLLDAGTWRPRTKLVMVPPPLPPPKSKFDFKWNPRSSSSRAATARHSGPAAAAAIRRAAEVY